MDAKMDGSAELLATPARPSRAGGRVCYPGSRVHLACPRAVPLAAKKGSYGLPAPDQSAGQLPGPAPLRFVNSDCRHKAIVMMRNKDQQDGVLLTRATSQAEREGA